MVVMEIEMVTGKNLMDQNVPEDFCLNVPKALLNQKVGRQWNQILWWRRTSQCREWKGGNIF